MITETEKKMSKGTLSGETIVESPLMVTSQQQPGFNISKMQFYYIFGRKNVKSFSQFSTKTFTEDKRRMIPSCLSFHMTYDE